jgi:hypothetical protein
MLTKTISVRINKLIFIKRVSWITVKGIFLSWITAFYFLMYCDPSPFKAETFKTNPTKDKVQYVIEPSDSVKTRIAIYPNFRELDDIQNKYKMLGQQHYSPTIEPHIEIIHKVLIEKGLQNDMLFIQAMFYIGQHESHWNARSISSFNINGEHPTGIFQFLPSTFISVSKGDIFNVEDQIRAFINMVERGRADEFQTLFICSYPPYLDPEAKYYLLNFPK